MVASFLIRAGAFTPAAGYEAEASALFARFGTDPGATRKGHINTLIASLKTDGVWSKLGAFYVLAAHDEADALLNWVGSSHTLTINGTPTFTTDRGFAIDSDINNRLRLPDVSTVTAYTQNSAHLGVWPRTGPTTSGVGAIRRADGAAGLSIFPRFGDNNAYLRVNDDPETGGFSVAGYAGFILGNRSGATAREGYKDGASIGSYGSSPSMAVPTQDLWIGAGSEAEVSVFTVGSSLTAGEVSDFYDALSVYKTAVGW